MTDQLEQDLEELFKFFKNRSNNLQNIGNLCNFTEMYTKTMESILEERNISSKDAFEISHWKLREDILKKVIFKIFFNIYKKNPYFRLLWKIQIKNIPTIYRIA